MYCNLMRAFPMVEAQTGIDAIVDQDAHLLPPKSGLSNKTRKDEAFGYMNNAKVPARAMKMSWRYFCWNGQ